MDFQTAYLWSVLPKLGLAALTNVYVALIIAASAIIAAVLLTMVRVMKYRIVNALISLVISFVRGTPLLIQIFICYYVLPGVGLDLSALQAGVFAISINSTVFIAETMRGSLQMVDPGQIEAASALGLSRSVIWHRILLPQLFRRILPMLVNEMTIIIKGTALLSVITVVEVLRTAQQIASATFRPFETLIGAALVFLIINAAFIALGSILEARLSARSA